VPCRPYKEIQEEERREKRELARQEAVRQDEARRREEERESERKRKQQQQEEDQKRREREEQKRRPMSLSRKLFTQTRNPFPSHLLHHPEKRRQSRVFDDDESGAPAAGGFGAPAAGAFCAPAAGAFGAAAPIGAAPIGAAIIGGAAIGGAAIGGANAAMPSNTTKSTQKEFMADIRRIFEVDHARALQEVVQQDEARPGRRSATANEKRLPRRILKLCGC